MSVHKSSLLSNFCVYSIIAVFECCESQIKKHNFALSMCKGQQKFNVILLILTY